MTKVSREQTRRNYDRMSPWYDLFASSEVKFTEIGLEMLDTQPGERVLEIGPGTGQALVELAQQTGKSGFVAGVDLSGGMIAEARKRLQDQGPERSVKLIQADATRLPLVPNMFDAVFLSFTLELFPESEFFVLWDELKRVLKADGRIGVVALQEGDTLTTKLYKWGHEQWPAVLDCRPIDAVEILDSAGLRIVKSQEKSMWGLPVKILLAEKTVSG